jgi:hypothetical protein
MDESSSCSANQQVPRASWQWSPKWGELAVRSALDVPRGCGKKLNQRRPSADIMYIYSYVFLYIYNNPRRYSSDEPWPAEQPPLAVSIHIYVYYYI